MGYEEFQEYQKKELEEYEGSGKNNLQTRRSSDIGDKPLKIQVLQAYYNRTYTSEAGEKIRLVVGRFRQNAARGYLRFRGAILVVTDKDYDRNVEVFRQPNAIRQIKLRKKRLAQIAKEKISSDEFLEELSSIIENPLEIEEGIGEKESPKREDYDVEIREIF